MNILRRLQFFLFFLGFTLTQSFNAVAVEKISGKEIKYQADLFFYTNKIDAKILVSDKRTFFECSEKLEFYPRIKNDWRTVSVTCKSNPWTVALRTSASAPSKQTDYVAPEETHATRKAVVLIKNISTGQVIDESYITISGILKNTALGSFNNLEDVIGRKVTRNLASGSVLKPRHLELAYDIEKNDTVIVNIGNSKLKVTTLGLALDDGQIGDAIRVKNIKSSKVFKAIISGKKKVTPLANM